MLSRTQKAGQLKIAAQLRVRVEPSSLMIVSLFRASEHWTNRCPVRDDQHATCAKQTLQVPDSVAQTTVSQSQDWLGNTIMLTLIFWLRHTSQGQQAGCLS